MSKSPTSDPWIKLLDLETKSLPVLTSHKSAGRPPSKFVTTHLHTSVSVDIKDMLINMVAKLNFASQMNQVLSYAIFLLDYEIKQLSDEELASLTSFYDLTKLLEEKRKRRK